jgi:hypothetical protein
MQANYNYCPFCGLKLESPGMPCPECKPAANSVYDDFGEETIVISEEPFEDQEDDGKKARPAYVKILALIGAVIFAIAAIINFVRGNLPGGGAELVAGTFFFLFMPIAWKIGCLIQRWGLPRKQYSGDQPFYYNMYILHWTVGPLIYTIGGFFLALFWGASAISELWQPGSGMIALLYNAFGFSPR